MTGKTGKWEFIIPCADDMDIRSFGFKLEPGQRVVYDKTKRYWLAAYRVDNPGHPAHGKLYIMRKEV
jgi:hypothetical protein